MKYLFYLSLSIYWLTYFLPFAYGKVGYEIELTFWSALWSNRPALSGVIVVWSLRCFVNALILMVCWMCTPRIQHWLHHHVDFSFLYQLLCGFIVVLLIYSFVVISVSWNWGGFLWAGSAFCTILFCEYKPSKLVTSKERDLDQHLVPLEEKP